MSPVRLLRSRYSRDRRFHHASRVGRRYVASCPARWSTDEVTDELAVDGTGSGKYATERCAECEGGAR